MGDRAQLRESTNVDFISVYGCCKRRRVIDPRIGRGNKWEGSRQVWSGGGRSGSPDDCREICKDADREAQTGRLRQALLRCVSGARGADLGDSTWLCTVRMCTCEFPHLGWHMHLCAHHVCPLQAFWRNRYQWDSVTWQWPWLWVYHHVWLWGLSSVYGIGEERAQEIPLFFPERLMVCSVWRRVRNLPDGECPEGRTIMKEWDPREGEIRRTKWRVLRVLLGRMEEDLEEKRISDESKTNIISPYTHVVRGITVCFSYPFIHSQVSWRVMCVSHMC